MKLRHRLVWLIAAILLVFGCQDSNKVEKPQVVRKKIANESSADAVSSKQEKDAEKQSDVIKDAAKTKNDTSVVDPAAELLATKGSADVYHYVGSLDPFVPLIKQEKSQPAPIAGDKSQKKRREPQTPLERIDLSQLTLTAVFRDNKRNMAMVEESTGKGYIVKKGTFIGLDGGKITKITKDRVMITEVSEDVMGKAVTIERELKLRQFSGE